MTLPPKIAPINQERLELVGELLEQREIAVAGGEIASNYAWREIDRLLDAGIAAGYWGLAREVDIDPP